MENTFIDESNDAVAFLVVAALVAVLIAMFYFRTEQYVEQDKTFDEVMDENDPAAKKKLKDIRLRKQELENELAEIDGRLREIKEISLGGHSSAYYTTELNELSMKRGPIANKLDIITKQEQKMGLEAVDFVQAVLDEEFNSKYVK